GILNLGTLTSTSDPNLLTLNHVVAARQTITYPALRFDYNLRENLRFSLVYNQTKTECTSCNVPTWPGGINPFDKGSVNPNNRIVSFSVDWAIRPTLMNQFHAGYTGQYSNFNPENRNLDLSQVYTQ